MIAVEVNTLLSVALKMLAACSKVPSSLFEMFAVIAQLLQSSPK